MKRIVAVLLSAFALLAVLAGGSRPHPAQAQIAFQTPTPGPDGRILYKVQAGDTCISISLLAGVDLETLRTLNNLSDDCVLNENQDLILGIVEPQPTPTIGATFTPTPLLPTPTAFAGTGQVCIMLYNDANGDGRRQESELALGDGQISLADRSGALNQSLATEPGEEPVCFPDLPQGEYSLSVGVPSGYNPTTVMSYDLPVHAGDTSQLNFGAQVSAAAQPLPPAEGGRSPLMGVLGGLVLLAGIGLGVYIKLFRR